MNFGTFAEITLTGVGIGSLYALVAIGFSLIYKITDVINFAQGHLALFGAYLVVILSGVGFLNPYAAVVLTLVCGILLGFLLERVVFRWFIGEPPLSVIIVTLALGFILAGLIRLLVKGETFLGYPSEIVVDWSLTIEGISMQGPFVLGVVFALGTVILLMSFFRYTVVGSIMRASASDQQAAMALGISLERNIVVAWTLSILITTIGGMLLAMSRGGIGFEILSVGIIIFAAVILGGLDSIPGAFIGAIVVGVLEQYGAFYLEPIAGAGVGSIVPMIFMLVVIVVLPYGLFGTERIERL